MLKYLARKILMLYGWTVIGHMPKDTPRSVLIAAPHTSNWDLWWMLLVAIVLKVRPNWLGKQELFRWPLGIFLRALGGIPVDRGTSQNAVQTRITVFSREEAMCLVIPPEGTRGKVDYWKSGFYHIAHGAGVPIVCSFLDYGTRTTGIGPIVQPCGDINADMLIFRKFYQGMTGRRANLFGPVRVNSSTRKQERPGSDHHER